jgi:hypothetical protein
MRHRHPPLLSTSAVTTHFRAALITGSIQGAGPAPGNLGLRVS